MKNQSPSSHLSLIEGTLVVRRTPREEMPVSEAASPTRLFAPQNEYRLPSGQEDDK